MVSPGRPRRLGLVIVEEEVVGAGRPGLERAAERQVGLAAQAAVAGIVERGAPALAGDEGKRRFFSCFVYM